MAELKVIVFNVERGLCVYARTPNNYGIMFDCGCCGDEFSPAEWVRDNEAPTLTKWGTYSLAWLVVTHPHDDHVEDIDNVKTILPPGILKRQKDYDWDSVLNPPDGDPSENAKAYHDWQTTYASPVVNPPDLGVKFETFSLTPKEAEAIDANNQHLLNNSSIVSVLTYQPVGSTASRKVVICGDNETASWPELRKKDGFDAAVSGADFFITPHHGHESGFSQDLFTVMGNPILNISSERPGDAVYEYARYASGGLFNGENRWHITTRNDGHVQLVIKDNMTYTATSLDI